MRWRTLKTCTAAAVTAVVCVASGAHAAPTAPVAPPSGAPVSSLDPPFEIVDPGVNDVSGAAYPMRMFPIDLSPHGMLRTYKVPGRQDLLMRTNGAIFAVFDESNYKRDTRIKKATVWRHAIPANTVFYIGRPDFNRIRSSGIRAVSLLQMDRPIERPAPKFLDSVPGVDRVKSEFLGTSREVGPKQRVTQQIVGQHPKPARVVSEDSSYPLLHRLASLATVASAKPGPSPRDPAPRPARSPDASAADANASAAASIDKLMRRASKDS